MLVYSYNKPQILEAVGNGSYLYHWDIREIEVTIGEDEQTTQWEYNEVVEWFPITREKIAMAVINELWDKDYEQKLINEYNSAVLGVYEGDVAQQKIDTYMAFLNERKRVKDLINADCEVLNIR